MATPNRRKKSSAVKKDRRKAPQRPKKGTQGFPFAAVAIALLLSAFIGYFMFAVEKPEVIKSVVKKTVKKEELLPEKPQPKWQYEQSLPSKEVVVDIPEKKTNTRPYQMQCAAFKNQEDAEALKAKIAIKSGLSSIVKKTGRWYRVILGPYDRKRLAEKERHILQRVKINGCQIWYWQ